MSEHNANQLDHANEERKERRHDQRTEPLDYIELRQEIRHAFTKEPAMSSHSTRQMIPTLPDVEIPARIVAVELMTMFDRLAYLGYSQTTLFEHHTPGASAALRAWAEANGHEISEGPLPGGATIVLSVTVAWPGPVIFVQRKVIPATPEEVAAEEARTVKP